MSRRSFRSYSRRSGPQSAQRDDQELCNPSVKSTRSRNDRDQQLPQKSRRRPKWTPGNFSVMDSRHKLQGAPKKQSHPRHGHLKDVKAAEKPWNMNELLAGLPDGDSHLRESIQPGFTQLQQDKPGASKPSDEDPAILSFTPSAPPRILKRPNPFEAALAVVVPETEATACATEDEVPADAEEFATSTDAPSAQSPSESASPPAPVLQPSPAPTSRPPTPPGSPSVSSPASSPSPAAESEEHSPDQAHPQPTSAEPIGKGFQGF